jgi:hypothetical protein
LKVGQCLMCEAERLSSKDPMGFGWLHAATPCPG